MTRGSRRQYASRLVGSAILTAIASATWSALAVPPMSRVSIFGWGANRAAVSGVDEQDFGKFYAQRTLLKAEVLPEHVANAAYALVGPDLTQTTGLHTPVDSGVAAAFLR